MPTVNINQDNLDVLEIILDNHERFLRSRDDMPPLALNSALNDVESIRASLGFES